MATRRREKDRCVADRGSDVSEFMKRHCRKCGYFNKYVGCSAEVDRECDSAWEFPDEHGKSMRQRIFEFCCSSARHVRKAKQVSSADKPRSSESVEDIILQIWNDGAEGIVYSDSDLREFEGRLRVAMDAERS